MNSDALPELDQVAGEAQTIADLAVKGVDPRPVDPDALYVVPHGDRVSTLDLEEYRSHPVRKRGKVLVRTAASFTTYFNKHADDTDDHGSEVWADPASMQVIGVINDHGAVEAGWGDHRVCLDLVKTPAWLAWTRRSGELMDQQTFAEHLEQRLVDIVQPPGAEMLELAQTFQATKSAAFESSQRLSSGEVQLAYKETVDAKAGKSGRLSIPETFDLGLIPFEGSNIYRVTARFRYRLHSQDLRVGYVLERPEDVARAAFDDLVETIADQIDGDVLLGVPRAP